MSKEDHVTPLMVSQLFYYDPFSGMIAWKKAPKSYMYDGQVITTIMRSDWGDYYVVGINYGNFLVHRVIWAWYFGEWPKSKLDHVDRNGLNNRITNLRPVTNSQNCMNQKLRKDNLLGVRGVSWRKDTGKYEARITVDKELIRLGYYTRLEDAATRRREAELHYFGDFAPV